MNYYHGHRDELVFKGEQATAFISLFDDDKTVQKVAKCIFADGLTNKQTAEKVGYSVRQIERLRLRITRVALRKLMDSYADKIFQD